MFLVDCNCLLDVLCKERIMNHHFEKRCGRALTFRPANIRNTQSQVNKQENLYHLGRQSVWDKYQQIISPRVTPPELNRLLPVT